MSPAQSRFADNDGIRIHYLDTDPTGTVAPVVFVPGLTCLASDYTEVLPHFGRRVVVIDLRGRGPSDSPQTGYHRDDHVTDIVSVLDDAGIDRYHLATFSRGTAYSLPLVFDDPNRVVSISLGDYYAGEMGVPGGVWDPSFINGRWRGTSVLSRITLTALEGIAKASVNRRYWAEVAKVPSPIQVARAGVSRDGHMLLSDDTVREFRAAVPQLEIVEFADSPHDIFRPDPTRYPKMVAEFTRRAERTHA